MTYIYTGNVEVAPEIASELLQVGSAWEKERSLGVGVGARSTDSCPGVLGVKGGLGSSCAVC